MAKLNNASKSPFYKKGALYLHTEDHATSDPTPKADAKKKVDKDPTKHFKSLGNNKQKMNAKNPYPKDSQRAKKFAALKERLKDSSF